MRRCTAWFLALWALALTATVWAEERGTLPADPNLDKPVSLTAVCQPLGQVLEQIAKITGAKLAVDDHMAGTMVSVGAADCPARDLMLALQARLNLEWQAQEGGGYRLRGAAFIPPVASNDRFLPKLIFSCPQWIRPEANAPPIVRNPAPPPMAAVYASLSGPLLDTLEEGGEIAFGNLPAAVQRTIAQHRQEVARSEAAEALNPRWGLPANALGIRIRPGAFAVGFSWELVAWQQAPAMPPMGRPGGRDTGRMRPTGYWLPVGRIPYQPGRPAMETQPPGGRRRVDEVAAGAAQRLRVGVVAADFDLLDAPEPAGETPEAILQSLIPESARGRWAWKQSGKAYWLRQQLPEGQATEPAELAKRRQMLEAVLPAEYKDFLSMTAAERTEAIKAPWARLWASLPEERRRQTAEPLAVSQLSAEQQTWLYAGLQAFVVNTLWSALEKALAGDLNRAVLSMDFEMAGLNQVAGTGYPRVLRIREGADVLLDGEVEGYPPLLRLLPAGDQLLRKRLDFEMKDETLPSMVGRLAEVMGAPSRAGEVEGDPKLSIQIKQRTLGLVMHCVERRTGMQWARRGGTYVLAPPIRGEDLTADPKRTLEAINLEIAATPAAPVMLQRSVTDGDRALLERGPQPLSSLSGSFQGAIREMVRSQARMQLTELETNWQVLANLAQTRVFLKPMGGTMELRLEAPGVQPRRFFVPMPQGR